jgi:diguanylate cyclase (GGDEF)-like protein
MTPAITPFLIGAMAVGLFAYLRPSVSLWIYVLAYGLFFYAIGLTQNDPAVLLSNRINGMAAVFIGSVLSVTLWRQFATLTLQKLQLESVNAELQMKQTELQRLTRLDGLTGLYNRNTFVELTQAELARAQRQGSSTSILLLDLDFFKRVNDTWGHPAGDAVLKNVAAVANRTVRATDLVGRLGGEEFIVLLPQTSLEAARRLAEKLRANLEQSAIAWDGQRITSTASFGLASTTAAEHLDFDHLYNQADKALYMAKERGRNRVV